MSKKARKRLIEELLPLAEIGVESSKSVSYGAIHAIHTWFARRPLAACRAATFAALVDAPATEKEREELIELIKKAVLRNAPFDDPEVIEEMRQRIRETFDGEMPKVLDPFAGGGSLPLEAARLGCEAHALDLNPVAVLTMLGTVDYPIRFAKAQFPLPPRPEDLLLLEEVEKRTGNLAEAVKAWGNWVLERVRPELEPFYLREPDGGTVVAYFWAKTVRCTNPACAAEIPLVAHRWLSRRKGKPPVAYKLVPQPDRSLKVEIVKGDEARKANPSRGTMARGSTQCPFCPQTLSPDEVKAQFMAGKSGRMMFAVAYKREGQSGTFFRAATERDREVFARAKAALAVAVAQHDDPFFPLVPDEPVAKPGGRYWLKVARYGVNTWGQMHNARQALALVTFCRGVRDAHQALLGAGANEESSKAVTLYLAFTLSRLVLRMSEASIWHNGRHTIERATAGHRLPMTWDYVEANPLSGGSGSWHSTLRWTVPAIDRVLGAAVEPALVRWGDAAKLAYPDDSFDAVLTDPGYYDSVGYSYLSDMQYVWLHRALADVFPEHFPAPLTPKQAEIIQDSGRHANSAEAKSFFEERLCVALTEMRRVLKPDGIGMVMYAHKATSAWETLVKALIDAGLQVTASWPVNTETTSRREWLGGAVLAATIFLVCRKRQGNRVAYLDEVLPSMREEVRKALARFWAAGIGGADFFISAIGPALSVYSQYSEVRYSSGQPVSVPSFLALVRQAVVDHSLSEALKGVDVGEVDRETQFALLWRWTYGNQQVETGAALLLDKATGVELADLERHGLLARANGAKKMVLLGPHQRPELLDDTLRRVHAGRAPLIDAIHCAALLWRENRREELAELLEAQTEATRKVAQALAELQPQSSTERRLILGFLGNWNHMRAVASRVAESELAEQLPLDI